MKILQIISRLKTGGAEKVAVTLANELNKNGIFVKLSYFSADSMGGLIYDDQIIYNPNYRFPGLIYLLNLCKFIRVNNIEIVHAHIPGGLNTLFGLVAAKITGRKYITTIHGNIFRSISMRLFVYKLILYFSDKIVAVSDFIKQQLLEKTNFSPNKIMTIYNGIDISPMYNDFCVSEKKKELNLDPKTIVIGSIGNVRWVKGYDVLIQSMYLLKKMYNFKLLIVGSYTNRKDIKFKRVLDEKIAKLNLKDEIIFLGERQDIFEILSIVDIFVLTSRSEGTPLSLLEAMLSKKAIVATSVGGIPFIIKQNINGLLVSTENPFQLAEAISLLKNDNALSKKLGEEARKTVISDYSLNKMTNRYLDLYKKTILS